jgi:hypothetical protein
MNMRTDKEGHRFFAYVTNEIMKFNMESISLLDFSKLFS